MKGNSIVRLRFSKTSSEEDLLLLFKYLFGGICTADRVDNL